MNIVLVLFAVVAVFLFTGSFRRAWITPHIFRLFKKLMPPLSKNEEEALLAGKVGIEATLLYAPKWTELEGILVSRISPREQAYLDGPVNQLCALLDGGEIDEKKNLPPKVWNCMKEIKIFGMNAPIEYGGLRFSKEAQRRVIVKIGSRNVDAAITAMVPNSLGPAELLAHYGTEAQKQRFLPGLSSGDIIPCFALTSPTAGSDAASLTDEAVVYRGADGVPMLRVQGVKRYITLAPVADLVGFACRLYDPESILGDVKDLGITLLLIPVTSETKMGGLSIGRRHDPLGGNFMNGPVEIKNLSIPLEESVIGGVPWIGKGWRMLMECLFVGRGISLPSISIGAGKFAVRTVGAYARVRKQFKLPLAEFGAIQEWLAKMGGYLYLMEATGMMAAESVDRGGSSPVISAIAKSHLTEKMREIVNCGMDIVAGKGIIQGPKNFLARYYEILPIALTVEGANRITDGFMIGGQGISRCHPALSLEVELSAQDESLETIKKFDQAIVSHVSYVMRGFFRAFFYSFGGWRFSPVPGKRKLSLYYRRVNRVSSVFCILSEIIIWVLRGKLKSEERISERLGKILSHLFISSAILVRFAKDGEKEEDRALAEWGLQYSLSSTQNAIFGILDNFPNIFGSPRLAGFLALILKRVFFPFGKPFEMPSDLLDAKIAHIITTRNESRERLTKDMYLPSEKNLGETVTLLEEAMKFTLESETAERKIRKALKAKKIGPTLNVAHACMLGVISGAEYQLLMKLQDLYAEVIAVDSFSSEHPRFSQY